MGVLIVDMVPVSLIEAYTAYDRMDVPTDFGNSSREMVTTLFVNVKVAQGLGRRLLALGFSHLSPRQDLQ
jgi:hypothetical protein